MAEGEQTDWMTQQTVALARQLNGVLSVDRDFASRAAAAKLAVDWALKIGFDAQTKAAAHGQLGLRTEVGAIRARLAAFKPVQETFYADWPIYRRDIERVWIEYCGLIAREDRLRAVSLVDEITAGLQALPRQLGEVVGTVANEAGKAAGKAIFGIFTGAGLITTVIIVGGAAAYWKYLK